MYNTDKQLYLIVSVILGTFFSVVFDIVLDITKRTLRDKEEVEEITKLDAHSKL